MMMLFCVVFYFVIAQINCQLISGLNTSIISQQIGTTFQDTLNLDKNLNVKLPFGSSQISNSKIQKQTPVPKWPSLQQKVTTEKSTAESCVSAETIVNGKTVCRHTLIFEDNLDSQTDFWQNEVKFADAPDYEFVLYTKHPTTLKVSEGLLTIKPTLGEALYGENFVRDPTGLDLGKRCTDEEASNCVRHPLFWNILPPVLSARINTKHKFSFLYGFIEIKAKLPKGDWLYPELFLMPKANEYGPHYASGQIRIAFTPGNREYSKTIYGGCILGDTDAGRTLYMRSFDGQKNWNDEFHIFSVKWTHENISFFVDGYVYGSVIAPLGGFSAKLKGAKGADKWVLGSLLAPFDKEMYLTVGVGVGGHSFKDSENKPWINFDPKAPYNFYRAKETWKKTWDENSKLIVDYIKVWAI